MPRMFTAIDLPATLKSQLAALRTDIPTARRVKPAQMHLTLRFVGEVSDKQAAALQAALHGVDGASFALALRGVGRFPPSIKKAPRVLWAGVDAPPELLALQAQIEQTVRTLGLPPDNKPFKPHFTLARLKTHKPTPEADAFLQAHAHFTVEPFAVSEFVLIESKLSPQGPHYTVRGRYALG